MTTRRRAREIVLQMLYEDDMNPTRELILSDDFIAMRMRKNKPLVAFGIDLLAGVRKNRKAIDSLISKHASNWSIKRMATIDRNILRLATFEMVLGGVPGRVVINEAVELAKRYGHHNSSQFVNGILDRILREAVEKKAPEESETDSSPEISTDPVDSPG